MKKVLLKVLGIVVLAIALFFVINSLISQQKTLNDYSKEIKKTEEQIESAREVHNELLHEKENINSTEYLEEIARKKLDMYLPNERVYLDIN